MTLEGGGEPVHFTFDAEVISWRGPSPFFFAPIPLEHSQEIRRLARLLTYGWGMIPVVARIAGVEFQTSLFQKDDAYLLPLKDAVRRRIAVTAGDQIVVSITLEPRGI